MLGTIGKRLILFLAAASLGAPAPSTVAVAVSWGPLRIDRVYYELRGVTRWPLTTGNEVQAFDTPALIEFPDRSRAWVRPGARAVVTSASVRVREGLVCWAPSKATTIAVTADGGEVKPFTQACLAGLPRTRPMPNVF